MDDHVHTQCLGHGIDGNIVMGGTDAARGEQVIVAFAQRVHRFDDPFHHIRHDAHFGEPDALDLKPACDLSDILVVRSARQDFVTDDDKSCGKDAFGHGKGVTRSAGECYSAASSC